jgi:prevent-host-death family protein
MKVNLYEAKTQLSSLVERARAGEEIIIAKGGRPVARLVALSSDRPARKPGRAKGKIRIGPDFDAPLPDDIATAFGADGNDASNRSPQ